MGKWSEVTLLVGVKNPITGGGGRTLMEMQGSIEDINAFKQLFWPNYTISPT